MNAEQLRRLSLTLDQLRSGEAWPFVYARHGPDNMPVLITGRDRLPVRELQTLMRWAPRKGLVRGIIARTEDGDLLLEAEQAPEGWLAPVRNILGQHIPDLANVAS